MADGSIDVKPTPQTSSYLAYLPALLQEDAFLGRFLLAFEQVLSGLHSANASDGCPGIISIDQNDLSDLKTLNDLPGLEQLIALAHTYVDCNRTPQEFLPWLAGWVGLTLRDDWEESTRRQFIGQIVPLYRLRGTKAALQTILALYLESAGFKQSAQKVQIDDEFDQIPHYFQVSIQLPTPDPELYWRQSRIATAIIDQEKPAHTFYALKVLVRTMQIPGQVYALGAVAGTGTLAARVDNLQVSRGDASPRAARATRLSLKLRQGQRVMAQQRGSGPLGAAATVSESGLNWEVGLVNLSRDRIQGTLTVTYPNGTVATPQSFTLAPGLQFPEKDPQGGRLNDTGNTFLGTDEPSLNANP
ncbi:phage tail protein [Phormidium tenue]|uniref:Phage tail protein I n=1 Tax=Phormidium tenue NIES-30 TaxID=549789 RepID=A0A1U7IY23_9CYAN|nr:phage tail protein [Phormidium tenue]MBD2233294.1 hypothetical protein [Phormidium tenue FACHB-1052]OKH43274.1 hypothetical protein NIES30_25320 [Phormidium tenue NIES-30]